MKSEKGVTLISIIVYMIGIILVISILSGISNFFFNNKNYLVDRSRYISEYNKFNMYFLDDIKKNKTAKIEQIYQKDKNNNVTDKVVGTRIILADGTVYTYREFTDQASDGTEKKDYGIYRNRAKICSGIEACTFKIIPDANNKDITTGPYKGKRIITVQMTIDEFTTSNNYVLRYW